MPEYVEREPIINNIGELFTICHETLPNECGHHFVVEKELQTFSDFVKSLTPADLVPVVRCKDCTHSRKGKASLECEKHRYAWDNRLRWVDDNDFCCWGARMDGARNG